MLVYANHIRQVRTVVCKHLPRLVDSKTGLRLLTTRRLHFALYIPTPYRICQTLHPMERLLLDHAVFSLRVNISSHVAVAPVACPGAASMASLNTPGFFIRSSGTPGPAEAFRRVGYSSATAIDRPK